MYLIIFIHEFGHIITSIAFNYNIKKINIYPFGGYTVFDDDINKSFIEEFLVFISGILFQIIFFIIIKLLVDNNLYIYKLFSSYNYTILMFNIIPIIPLDGSKIINIILNKIMPFKYSHLITIFISYALVIITFIFTYANLNMTLMLTLMIFLITKEYKNHIYIFNAFLLERYLKNIKFKKNNIINSTNIKKTKKYCNNVFLKNNNYISEKEILSKKFN